MPFTFKQFHIDDTNCGMPVSTDGVLLGAWAQLKHAKQIVDIGSGSGLLSLMAAQRSQAYITAIELDDNAIQACQKNFAISPWANRLTALHCPIQDFTAKPASFDHIVCNPPYFIHGPQSQSSQRAAARHTDTLSFTELLTAIKTLLSQTGIASLILPTVSLSVFIALLPHHQLKIYQIVDVASIEGKSISRHLISLRHASNSHSHGVLNSAQYTSQSHINIRNKNGEYSKEMRQLTKAFYLKL